MNLLLALQLDTVASGFAGARFLSFRADTPFVLTEEGFVLKLWGGADTVLGPFPPPPGGILWLGDSLLVLSGGKLFLGDTALLSGLPVQGVGLKGKGGEVIAGFGGEGFLSGCALRLLPQLRVLKCFGDLGGFGFYRRKLVGLTQRGAQLGDTLLPLPERASPSAALQWRRWLIVLAPGDPSLPPGEPPAGVWILPKGVRLPLPVNPHDGALKGDTLYLLEDSALLRLVLKRREIRRILRHYKKR